MPFNIGLAAVPEWAWALGPLILLSGTIVLSFLHPFAAPLLAVVLIVGGIVAYRQSTNAAAARAIAAAAIAAGTLIILTVILVGLCLITTRSTETVTEGMMITPMIKP